MKALLSFYIGSIAVTSCFKEIIQYEIEHISFAIRSDLCYITFSDDDDILSCTVSSGHFCRLDRAFH